MLLISPFDNLEKKPPIKKAHKTKGLEYIFQNQNANSTKQCIFNTNLPVETLESTRAVMISIHKPETEIGSSSVN